MKKKEKESIRNVFLMRWEAVVSRCHVGPRRHSHSHYFGTCCVLPVNSMARGPL